MFSVNLKIGVAIQVICQETDTAFVGHKFYGEWQQRQLLVGVTRGGNYQRRSGLLGVIKKSGERGVMRKVDYSIRLARKIENAFVDKFLEKVEESSEQEEQATEKE